MEAALALLAEQGLPPTFRHLVRAVPTLTASVLDLGVYDRCSRWEESMPDRHTELLRMLHTLKLPQTHQEAGDPFLPLGYAPGSEA